MEEIQVVLGLLVVVALIATVSRLVGMPYPILMVIGGLLLGLVPGVPRVVLTPDLVLVIFLPPILFAAAYFTSLRDLRANVKQIGQLAFLLVLITMSAVAIVAHTLLPEIGWAAAFALGAIVAPPDAIAATAIAQRVGLPRRAVVILEGESLVNDATALTAYRVAVAVAVGGSFTLGSAAVQLLVALGGGIAIGIAIGWVTVKIEGWLNDAPVETIVSLIAPFAAYLPAERLGVSGVLAAVSAGLMLGRFGPRVLTSQSRVLATSVWEMVVFLINSFVFVLIGLQLPLVVGSTGRSLGEYVAIGLAVAVTVIVVRIAWIFATTYGVSWLRRRGRTDRMPGWRGVAVLSWAGMRGSVTLAAALALPVSPPFPGRSLILFSAFMVILATLVVQGLTLPAVVRRLGVGGDTELGMEETRARQVTTEAALARLDGLRREWPGHIPLVDQLRERYEHRTEHVTADPADEAADQELLEHRRIRHEVIEAERLAVIQLRDAGEISDNVLHRLERELDLEELRMEA
ncbi:MAG TPA: Na+/H+ antiporter [Candidatus Limnocylindria bacterium]|nr:Na+/H+ antiporter [Candidatus Limnocylindria bacterium]